MLETGVEDKGLFFTADGSNGINCYTDKAFSVEWFREDVDQVR